ncbi:mannobiose 2-epimerase [Anaerotaenia torta]|uniref:AGE family epimerase/isomerase n=1 Tax=Anaerotaenia torta TaxID=433293 RepID=UPI003D1A4F10
MIRVKEIREHLVGDIIPFWQRMKDEEHGGYYGEMDFDLKLFKKADKGCILNSRILWFFSNAYLTLGDKECLACAGHAWEFLRDCFYDKENGGVFWSVTYDGRPSDDMKHTYCQAFAVYGLSSYYAASGEREVLSLAYSLADKMEGKCRDEGGYLEAFDRNFSPASNEKLSENGVMAGRTMNTLLHVLEAYTELYRVDRKEFIGNKIRWMLELFAKKVYHPGRRRLEVFFDLEMNSLIDLNSYGHDIEAAWLLDRSTQVLQDPVYTALIRPVTMDLTDHIHSVAMDTDSLNNECEEGRVDTRKVWWVQAEAVLGFLNGYEKKPDRVDYLESAGRIWDYIKTRVIDPRPGSEWFNELYRDGTPIKTKELAGPWKCPYHNGRMCFEVINKGIQF